MKFCSECGNPLAKQVPEGDDRERMVCTSCSRVHYSNPLVVVGCVVEHEGKVLLCRRAIEPAHGKWTIPAGFLELNESLADGARRETAEEACAAVEILAPHSQLELTHISQLHVTYRARMLDGKFAAGTESLECALFRPEDIPWQDMAFPAGIFALRLRFGDGATPHMHSGRLRWNGEGSRFDPSQYVIDDHRKMLIA